jgi:hypothetical protein
MPRFCRSPQRTSCISITTVSHYITATLANGGRMRFRMCRAAIDWFGNRRLITVAVSGVQRALLGAPLLKPHTLIIDYGLGTVEIR